MQQQSPTRRRRRALTWPRRPSGKLSAVRRHPCRGRARLRARTDCCWQESVKPLQFHCHTLPLFYQLHERQLLFYRRLLLSDNMVLRTLAGLPRVRFEILGIATKYDVDDLHYSTKTVKNAVWLSFVSNIIF